MECGFESCLMKPVLFYRFTNFQCYLLNTRTDQCYMLNSPLLVNLCIYLSTSFFSLQVLVKLCIYLSQLDTVQINNVYARCSLYGNTIAITYRALQRQRSQRCERPDGLKAHSGSGVRAHNSWIYAGSAVLLCPQTLCWWAGSKWRHVWAQNGSVFTFNTVRVDVKIFFYNLVKLDEFELEQN